MLAELLADPATTFVRPSALTAPAVAELVRARLSPDADDAFCRACHRTTGGNPLLLHELVRTLATEEIKPSAACVEAVERLAPDAVARSVRLRLSRLPPEAAALARAVAVLGDGADGSHAAALAALERRTLAPAAAALARVGLLQAEPPLRFVHPLVRNAVYESIGAHERALEHARAAARPHLGGRGRGGGRRSAPAGTVAKRRRRRDSASRSGRSGRRRGRSRQRRALPPTGARRANTGRRARGAAARACRRGAESRSATIIDRLQEAVRLVGDPERRAQARLELGRALYWAGHEEDAIDVLEQALAERDCEDDLQRRLQAELFANATRLPSRYEGARRRLDSVEVRPAQGPGARMLLGLQAYHEASSGGSRERAIERAELALAAMSNEELAWNYVPVTYALLVADHLDEPVRYLDRLIAAARERGAVFNFAGLSMMRAVVHYARGAIREAEADADARTALDVLPHRRVWFAPHVHGWSARRSSSSAGPSTRPPSCSRPGSSSSPPTPTRSSERRYCVARRWC